MMSCSPKTLARIQKDWQALRIEPLPYCSAEPVHDSDGDVTDLHNWHGTVEIRYGPYMGMRVHLIIRLPVDYPHSAPTVMVHGNQGFSSKLHRHIFSKMQAHPHLAVCNDMTAAFESHFSRQVGTGWSPGCTVKDLLLSMQVFLGDPDGAEPSLKAVTHAREQLGQFRCDVCRHTTDRPWPPLDPHVCELMARIEQQRPPPEQSTASLGGDTCSGATSSTTESRISASDHNRTLTPRDAALQRLVCGVTKMSLLEDPRMILGYPLMVRRQRGNSGRLYPTAVIELISYDAYMTAVQQAGHTKLDDFEHITLRTPGTCADYNFWLPVYLSESHYNRSRSTFEHGISVIARTSASGAAANDFQPEMALQVLPALINQTTVQMLNGEMHESVAALEAYCHFVQMLLVYLDKYPQLQQRVNAGVVAFNNIPAKRHKTAVPDIGEFLVKVFCSDIGGGEVASYDIIKKVLVQEYFVRQVRWMFQNDASIAPQRRVNQNPVYPLEKCFRSTHVSNMLLPFNIGMARLLIPARIDRRRQFLRDLEERVGFPTAEQVAALRECVRQVRAMQSYQDLWPLIGMQNSFLDDASVRRWLHQCEQLSFQYKYHT